MSGTYHFNPHAVPVLFAALLVLLFGIVLRLKRREASVSAHFLTLSLGIFVWLFCTAMGYMSVDKQQALWWFRMDNAGVMFISPSFFAFSATLINDRIRRFIPAAYVIAGLFSLCSLLGWFPTSGVQRFSWGYFPRWSIVGSLPIFLFFFGLMGKAFTILKEHLHQTVSVREKNQIRYVLLAFVIAYFGSVDYMPTFGMAIYPFGFIPILGLVAILFYAVVKHSLLDITILIRKTLIYSVITGTLTLFYLGLVTGFTKIFEGLAGYQTIFSSGLAAALITLGFQPLRKRVQVFVDRKFFRQYVDREEKLYELSREVITHTTPEAMGGALMRVLGDTLHPKTCALYLRAKDGSGFSRVSKIGSSSLSDHMEEENELAIYFKDHPQPFVQDVSGDVGHSMDTRLKSEREDAA